MSAVILNSSRSAFLKRFDSLVERVSESGCWFWMGQVKLRGHSYGRWYVSGVRERYAHRLAWMLFRGPIPPSLWVLHRCDIPFCVNPAHLFLGTAADNAADMVEKGRAAGNPNLRGTQNPQAILSEEDVSDVLNSRDTGVSLAARYGVSSGTIYQIRKGRSWPDVPRGVDLRAEIDSMHDAIRVQRSHPYTNASDPYLQKALTQ